MDAEEERDGLSPLEEEADQLPTHELYTGPLSSAEIIPHDLDGAYGANFPEHLDRPPIAVASDGRKFLYPAKI